MWREYELDRRARDARRAELQLVGRDRETDLEFISFQLERHLDALDEWQRRLDLATDEQAPFGSDPCIVDHDWARAVELLQALSDLVADIRGLEIDAKAEVCVPQ